MILIIQRLNSRIQGVKKLESLSTFPRKNKTNIVPRCFSLTNCTFCFNKIEGKMLVFVCFFMPTVEEYEYIIQYYVGFLLYENLMVNEK